MALFNPLLECATHLTPAGCRVGNLSANFAYANAFGDQSMFYPIQTARMSSKQHHVPQRDGELSRKAWNPNKVHQISAAYDSRRSLLLRLPRAL